MAPVITLPPQEIPSMLTAAVRPHNLEEQFIAFMAANNPNWYSDEPAVKEHDWNKLGDVMMNISRRDTMYHKTLIKMSKTIVNLINQSLPPDHKPYDPEFGREVIARIFGYTNWYSMSKKAKGETPNSSKQGRLFPNIRKSSLKGMNLKIHNQDVKSL